MRSPISEPDSLTAPFWEHARRGIFVLPRCESCGRHHFYPRIACPFCGGGPIAWVEASGRGRVYSCSVVYRAPSPAFAADVPYVIAIVETEEGPHLMSRIVGMASEKVAIGMSVRCLLNGNAEAIAPVAFVPDGGSP